MEWGVGKWFGLRLLVVRMEVEMIKKMDGHGEEIFKDQEELWNNIVKERATRYGNTQTKTIGLERLSTPRAEQHQSKRRHTRTHTHRLSIW